MFDVRGKVVLITGSSRGIGKAIALQMAKSGSKVVISSRSKENCDDFAKELIDCSELLYRTKIRSRNFH